MYTNRRHQSQTSSWSLPRGALTHPIALLLWTLLCLIIGIRLIHSALAARQAFATKAAAEKILREEEEKAVKLIERVNQADQPFAQEKIIRDELNLQKPGEIILQLPTSSPKE